MAGPGPVGYDTGMARRLVLVDGSAMLFRAYYAIPGNLRTSTGQPTNVVYGFATMFRKLFSGRPPDLGAVVFDAPGKSFRAARFEGYKRSREAAPEDLVAQRELVDRLVECQGFPVLRCPGYEADDVIGTLTVAAVAEGIEVSIVSSDKDFVQVLGPTVRMFDAMRDITYDVALAEKKWGVKPERFVDLLALTGDTSDDIPGVPGIGKKTASALLDRYGDLEGVLAHTAELPPRQRAALETHREQARLSKELATFDTQVPLPLGLRDLVLPPPEPERLNEFYLELEFHSLLTETETETPSTPVAVLGPDSLGPWLDAAAHVALFPVIDPPAVAPGAWVGLGLARGDEELGYADVRRGVPEPLSAFLTDPSRPKWAHEAKALWVLIPSLDGVAFDTQLASFLIDPNRLLPHRLDQLSKAYLQTPLPPAKRLQGSGQKERRFAELEPEAVADWAGKRAGAVFSMVPKLVEALSAANLSAQLRDVDLPLSAVLARMERAGVPVAPDELETAERDFEKRLTELEAEIHELAGRPFHIGSPKQLAEVLFVELKLPVVKRTKTGHSTDAEVLERLAPKHPIARALLEHRKLSKLVTTYTRVLRAAIRPDTGRVHATLQQTAGVTGRLISTDPDLQRTPIKSPEGERVRRAFVAPTGRLLVSADYSQIELRLLAHLSEDPALLDAFAAGADVHKRTAAALFSVTVDEVTPEQRRIGKTVNFATIYGQGATALGQILGVPRAEAKRYIDGYFAAHAGVRRWLDGTIAEAQKTGYVTTLDGRRRHIPELSSHAALERAAGERIAANTPIQGSAADLCKRAMLEVDRRLPAVAPGAQMILQIHDELLFCAPEAEAEAVAALARETMAGVAALRVPLVVEVGIGPTWAEAH